MKFTHNGIGKLADTQSCTVTEKRNGSYELKLVCPADGIHAEMLEEGNIILAKPSDTMQSQPFRIYKITTPIDGKLEVQARHISYQLNFITVSPFSVTGCIGAMQGLKSHAASDCPFDVWTDVDSSATFTLGVPSSFRNCLGGMDASVLDTFDGEFEWDRYLVKFHKARGADHNVHITYGKNLTDFKMEKSIENTITGVHPYWVDSETQEVMELPEKVVLMSKKFVPYQKITVLDCTSDFQEKPTEDALREFAQNYIDTTDLTEPEIDIKIDFVQLWNTPGYEDIVEAERVSLCDTVHVYISKLGIEVSSKVTETEYDSLLERYNSITLSNSTVSSRNSSLTGSLNSIRVSTDMSDQENSYETQEKYFNQLIQSNPEWNAVGVYSDYGISGTSKEKRTGFRRLMRHCKDGKIDRIVCKSISRFARNTADFMTALDTLHDCGVTILFEKENLDTADPTSDFILTTLAAIAQEESRSISGNIRQGNKMRFPKGEVPNKIMYGYRYNGKMVTSESGYEYKDIEVVEEEAKVVRRIFNEVVEGKAYTEIARGLNLDKIPAPESDMARARKRNSKKGQLNSDLQDGWTGGNITRIVRAERYMGAVLIQKVFTPDYLTHTVQKNNGEVPQYFVRNHHPAIIDEDLFQKAQEVVKANSELYNRTRFKKKPRAFSQRLICGECGRFYSVTNGNGSNPIWRCPTSSQTTGKCICHAEKVYEEQIVRVFRKAILERFRLTIKPIHDNVAVADIMSGRFKEQYDNFTPEADSFVSQMLARLESIQKLDFMERDRAFYKKQIAVAHTSVESTNKKIRLLKSQVDVMHTRLEVLGDEMISPASIEEKKKLIEKLEQDVQKDTDTEQKLTEQLDYMENYWEELESDYERREKAIEWMKNLPVGRDGTVAFLNEVTEEHCKEFILSITIYSPLKFTVHWFDDTKTEVQMDSNIEDYRNTASYYDGHTMRDGSQRKKYVRRTRRK